MATEDIVVKLKREGEGAFRKHYSLGMWLLCSVAGDEIMRLRAENERLRAALEPFSQLDGPAFKGYIPGALVKKLDVDKARAALEREP